MERIKTGRSKIVIKKSERNKNGYDQNSHEKIADRNKNGSDRESCGTMADRPESHELFVPE
jgi:hypothetical protein